MAGSSAARLLGRFWGEGSAAPVKEVQDEPLQHQQGYSQEDGLERCEKICYAAEDAPVECMNVEQGVDEVGGQGVDADNAEGKRP